MLNNPELISLYMHPDLLLNSLITLIGLILLQVQDLFPCKPFQGCCPLHNKNQWIILQNFSKEGVIGCKFSNGDLSIPVPFYDFLHNLILFECFLNRTPQFR